MHVKGLAMALCLILGSSAHAVGEVPLKPTADYRNYVRQGIRISVPTEATLGYSYKVHPQVLVGVTGSVGGSTMSTSGGSLDNAQYYTDESRIQSGGLELNGTFYLRENGASRWGVLFRGGLGHEWVTTSAKWTRYDRNPAVIIIGDDKRELESQSSSASFQTTYLRFGSGYQFAWNFNPGNRVGHVLEIGLEGIVRDRGGLAALTKPDGEEISQKLPQASVALFLSYSVAF